MKPVIVKFEEKPSNEMRSSLALNEIPFVRNGKNIQILKNSKV